MAGNREKLSLHRRLNEVLRRLPCEIAWCISGNLALARDGMTRVLSTHVYGVIESFVSGQLNTLCSISDLTTVLHPIIFPFLYPIIKKFLDGLINEFCPTLDHWFPTAIAALTTMVITAAIEKIAHLVLNLASHCQTEWTIKADEIAEKCIDDITRYIYTQLLFFGLSTALDIFWHQYPIQTVVQNITKRGFVMASSVIGHTFGEVCGTVVVASGIVCGPLGLLITVAGGIAGALIGNYVYANYLNESAVEMWLISSVEYLRDFFVSSNEQFWKTVDQLQSKMQQL